MGSGASRETSMTDKKKIIDFKAAASTIRKSKTATDRPSNEREHLRERAEQARASTERRLNEAEELRDKLNTKLSHDDRRQIVKNLGSIAVSLFGGETEAKRKMTEVFRTAFGSDYDSFYKKRGRFFRFPSEGEPGDGPGATYAQGWAYLNIAQALAKLNPQSDLDGDRSFNRMILRMIEGTAFDSTALAKGRLAAKAEAAYRGVLRDLMMKLEPKLAQMLEAGLESGKTLEDFSIDPDGMIADEFADRELPKITLGRVVQDIPVVHAWPAGFTLTELSDRLLEIVRSKEMQDDLVSRWDISLRFDEKVKSGEWSERQALVTSLGMCGVFPIILELIQDHKGIDFAGLNQKDALQKVIDLNGRHDIALLKRISDSRFETDRLSPNIKDLTNQEILDQMVAETRATTRENALRQLTEVTSSTKKETGPSFDMESKESAEAFANYLVKLLQEQEDRINYNYAASLRHSPAFMSVAREVWVSPVLDSATGEWRLAAYLEPLGQQDLDPRSREVESIIGKAIEANISSWEDDIWGLLFLMLAMGSQPWHRIRLDGMDRSLVVGWTIDAETEEVVLTVVEDPDFLDELARDSTFPAVQQPVWDVSQDWVSVLQSPKMIAAALAAGRLENDEHRARLDLELSAGEAHPFFPADSFARAFIADLHVGKDDRSPSKILSNLTEEIETRTAELAGQAVEKLEAVEDGLRYLRD